MKTSGYVQLCRFFCIYLSTQLILPLFINLYEILDNILYPEDKMINRTQYLSLDINILVGEKLVQIND